MLNSRLDYLILNLLDANSANTPIKGMTVDEMAEAADRISANITLYKRVKVLMNLNYVAKGVKDGKADTYFITGAGLQIKSKGEESI
jgi:hypothetical protein